MDWLGRIEGRMEFCPYYFDVGGRWGVGCGGLLK